MPIPPNLRSGAITARLLILAAVTALTTGSAIAQAPDPTVSFDSSAPREAETTLRTNWNGQPAVFTTWLDSRSVQNEDGDLETVRTRRLEVVLNGDRRLAVGAWDEQGGPAEIKAIFFANADNDPALELIVITTWPVQHADVVGAFYEVRVYDDVATAQGDRLRPIPALNKHFGAGCYCERQGATPDHYSYHTVAAVKSELRRMGFR